MRHGEFEQRRRALEKQLEEDLELVRSGYRAKLRALEMLWLASPGEDGHGAEPVPADPQTVEEAVQGPSETLSASETLPSETPSPSETLNETPASASPAIQRGDALRDITAALDQLPAVFDKEDLVRILGYKPPRATLYRVISQLKENQKIATQEYSNGRTLTKYRKL